MTSRSQLSKLDPESRSKLQMTRRKSDIPVYTGVSGAVPVYMEPSVGSKKDCVVYDPLRGRHAPLPVLHEQFVRNKPNGKGERSLIIIKHGWLLHMSDDQTKLHVYVPIVRPTFSATSKGRGLQISIGNSKITAYMSSEEEISELREKIQEATVENEDLAPELDCIVDLKLYLGNRVESDDKQFLKLLKKGKYSEAASMSDNVCASALTKKGQSVMSSAVDAACSTSAGKDQALAVVRRMANRHADAINCCDRFGNTPLHYAVEKGDVIVVKELLSRGADVARMNFSQRTAYELTESHSEIAVAMESFVHEQMLPFMVGDIVEAQNALEGGLSPNFRGANGRTLMHMSAANGCVEILRLLLSHGANICPVDRHGRTPVHVAAMCCTVQDDDGEAIVSSVLSELHSAGADLLSLDLYGMTALHCAVNSENVPALRTLLSLTDSDDRINQQDRKCRATALHMAVDRNNTAMVELLLVHGARLDRKDNDADTPESLALTRGEACRKVARLFTLHSTRNQIIEAAKGGNLAELQSTLANPLARSAINEKDASERTALHYAVQDGRVAIAKLLVDFGADWTIPGPKMMIEDKVVGGKMEVNVNAFELAEELEIDELVSRFQRDVSIENLFTLLHTTMTAAPAIKNAVDTHLLSDWNVYDATQHTMLTLACQRGDLESLKILLPICDPKVCDQIPGSRRTPLHWAIKNKHTNCAAILIKDDRVEMVVQDGTDSRSTPIHEAAKADMAKLVTLMMRRNVDISVRDGAGRTPLEIAKAKDAITTVMCIENMHAYIALCRALRRQYVQGVTEQIDQFPLCVMQKNARKQNALHIAAILCDGTSLSVIDKVVQPKMTMKALDHLRSLGKQNPLAYGDMWMARRDANGFFPSQLAKNELVGQHIRMIEAFSSLSAAVRRSSSVEVRQILNREDRLDLNKHSHDGDGLLHIIARSNDVQCFNAIMSERKGLVDLNLQHSVTGESPLHVAVKCLSQDVFRRLLEEGADWRASCRDRTPGDYIDEYIASVERGSLAHLYAAVYRSRCGEILAMDKQSSDKTADDLRDLYRKFIPENNKPPSAKDESVWFSRLGSMKDLLAGKADERVLFREVRNDQYNVIMMKIQERGVEDVCKVYDEEGRTVLHFAAVCGSVTVLRKLLELGANVAMRDRKSRTALEYARTANHHDAIQILSNFECISSVSSAIRDRDVQTLEYLVSRIDDDMLQAINDGQLHFRRGLSCIHEAFISKNPSAVQTLISRGFDWLVPTELAMSGLHWGCAVGATDCIQVLLEYGDLTQDEINMKDELGRTPLMTACIFHNYSVLQLLLGSQLAPYVDVIDAFGRTPLIYAALDNSSASVLALLERGADPNVTCQYEGVPKRTPLIIAALVNNVSMVDALLTKSPIPVEVDACDAIHNRAIDYACAKGNANVVRMLLKNGASLIHKCRDVSKSAVRLTPLHYACISGMETVVRVLIEHDPACVNVGADEEVSFTPLHCAIVVHRSDIVKLLIDCGADINVPFFAREGPNCMELARACKLQQGHLFLVGEKLFGQKINEYVSHGDIGSLRSTLAEMSAGNKRVRYQDENGDSILHNALRRLQYEAVRLLIQRCPYLLQVTNKKRQRPSDVLKDLLQEDPSNSQLSDIRDIVEAGDRSYELMEALRKGAVSDETLASFVTNDIEPHIIDSSGNTLLHLLAKSTDAGLLASSHYIPLVEKLAECVEVYNDDGYSALHTAAKVDNVAFMRMIMESPVCSFNIRTPLLYQSNMMIRISRDSDAQAEDESRNPDAGTWASALSNKREQEFSADECVGIAILHNSVEVVKYLDSEYNYDDMDDILKYMAEPARRQKVQQELRKQKKEEESLKQQGVDVTLRRKLQFMYEKKGRLETALTDLQTQRNTETDGKVKQELLKLIGKKQDEIERLMEDIHKMEDAAKPAHRGSTNEMPISRAGSLGPQGGPDGAADADISPEGEEILADLKQHLIGQSRTVIAQASSMGGVDSHIDAIGQRLEENASSSDVIEVVVGETQRAREGQAERDRRGNEAIDDANKASNEFISIQQRYIRAMCGAA